MTHYLKPIRVWVLAEAGALTLCTPEHGALQPGSRRIGASPRESFRDRNKAREEIIKNGELGVERITRAQRVEKAVTETQQGRQP